MRRVTLVASALVALSVAGCGTATRIDFRGHSRPSPPVDVSVYVSQDQVLVSPRKVRAGLVRFNVANESGARKVLSLVPAHSTPSNAALRTESFRSGPIPNGGTAQVTFQIPYGRFAYVVSAGGSGPLLNVTRAPRQAGNSALLQP